jgi:hypothetical protein
MRAEKAGTQHLIDEEELERVIGQPPAPEVPGGWGQLPDGSAAPDWAKLVRRAREAH